MYWNSVGLRYLLEVMLLFMHQVLGTDANVPTSEVLDSISEALIDEDYIKAYGIFLSSSEENKQNPRFANEYYQFLLNIGHYDEVIRNSSIFSNVDLDLLKNYQKVLNSGNIQEMAKLVDVSPNCAPVLYAAAKWAIFNQDKNKLNKIIGKLENINSLDGRTSIGVLTPDFSQYREILARKHFLCRNIQSGLGELRKIDSDAIRKVVETYESVLTEFFRITNVEMGSGNQRSVRSNLESLKRLYFHVYRLKVNDRFKPSIFLPIMINVLEKISEFSIQNGVSGYSGFTERLLEIDPTELNVEMAIRTFCLDGRIQEAKNIFKQNRMNRRREEEMKKIIQIAEEDRRREEENRMRERQRREQQRREQQRRQFASTRQSQKEPDFLKYYEILGVKSDVDDKTLKKAYKRKAREADKKMRQKKAEAKENTPVDESDLIKVNKAYQILSDAEKRRVYDMGIDPESPEPQYHQYQQSMDFDEVISRMFGGGSGRQQFFQFSF